MTRDPYEILGLEPDADADSVRRAYRRLAKKHHPDLWGSAPDMVQRHVARKMAVFNEAVKEIDHRTGVIDQARVERERLEGERRQMFERWERAEVRARALEERYADSRYTDSDYAESG